MKPDYYTSLEGSPWKKWTFGRTRKNALNMRSDSRAGWVVYINSVPVHSLCFAGRRWDCRNGWTPGVKTCPEN